MWSGLLTPFVLALAPQATAPLRAVPTGNTTSWVTVEDYPADAIIKHQEGDVGVALYVDATGRVADCIVTKSSGAQSLDLAPCTLLRRRARFTASSTGSSYAMFNTSIRWAIPADAPPTPVARAAGSIHACPANLAAAGSLTAGYRLIGRYDSLSPADAKKYPDAMAPYIEVWHGPGITIYARSVTEVVWLHQKGQARATLFFTLGGDETDLVAPFRQDYPAADWLKKWSVPDGTDAKDGRLQTVKLSSDLLLAYRDIFKYGNGGSYNPTSGAELRCEYYSAVG